MPTIRPAGQEDLEAIAALHVSSWQSAYRGILPDPILDQLSAEQRQEDWLRWFAVPEAHTYAAFQQRRLVGFARVVPACAADDPLENCGEISHLYVAPESQSMGVGRALLAHAVEDIVSRGLERVVLWVMEKNYRARAFYERAGFRLDGARRIDPERLGTEAPEVRYQIAVAEAARP